ncbi:hypothetical protein A2U01_0049849, partial [Trifolium medium]|nr:hypothetical protein [Trifolium medium]
GSGAVAPPPENGRHGGWPPELKNTGGCSCEGRERP